MRKSLPLCTALALLTLASAAIAKGNSASGKTSLMEAARAGKTLYATIETSKGKITAELDPKIAPIAVENFVGLATGEKEWTAPSGEKVHKPIYDGTVFHRIIPLFMIQGGDPTGSGQGGPGFQIQDDFPNQTGMHFKKGTLGMARTMAPNSSGCQFFITVADTPWLDGQYTVFGHVLTGQEVADEISKAPRGPGDRPREPITIKKVTISEKKP